MGVVLVKSHATSVFADWYAAEIKKRTNGRVQIDVYYAQELGKNAETLQLIGAGAYEMGIMSPAFFPAQFPLNQMPESIYGIWPNQQVVGYTAYEAANTTGIADEFERNNVKFMYTGACTPYYFFTSDPVEKLSDLQGLKIRTFGAYLPKHIQKFGAVSVSIPAMEAYEALQTGAMDGTMAMASELVDYSLFDVTKHLWKLQIGNKAYTGVIMNLAFWKKLPQDIRDIFQAVNDLMVDKSIEIWPQQEADAIKAAKAKGMTIHEVSAADQAAWDTYGVELMNSWLADMDAKGLGGPAQQMLAIRSKYLAKYPQRHVTAW